MKTIKILALGDVVGPNAVDYLQKNLGKFVRENGISLTVANGENASVGNGISSDEAHALFDAGVDIITTGNHVFKKRSIYEMLDDNKYILRPANYPSSVYGKGFTKIRVDNYIFLVINVQGRMYMDPINCPFEAVDKILAEQKGSFDFSLIDIHAEATAEKIALAYYLDGRVDCIFGTHTHVPTADEQILPKGSGYITDIGMCGPINSALGVKTELIIEKFRTNLPCKFEISDNKTVAMGVVFSISAQKNKVVLVERVKI